MHKCKRWRQSGTALFRRMYSAGDDIDVKRKRLTAAVLQVAFERFVDNREGKLLPGDFFFAEKTNIAAFTGRLEAVVFQLRPKEEVDLADVGDIVKSVRL